MNLMSTLGALIAGPLLLGLAHSVIPARKLAVCLGPLAVLLISPQLFYTSSQFSFFLITWFFCAVCFKGLHSMIEAAAVRESATEEPGRFEKTRIWGSVGYILSTLVGGVVLDYLGVSPLGTIGGLLLATLGVVTFKSRAKFSNKLGSKDKGEESIFSFLKRGKAALPVVALFLINTLIWASHSVYYTYYSVYLKQLGFSGATISVAWSIGVIAEVVFFLCFSRYANRFSLVGVLRHAVVFTSLRWLILAYSTNIYLLLIAQVFHLYSFGALYLASVKLTYKLLPDELRDRGQGYLTAFSGGLGSSIGRYTCSLVALSWTVPEMFLACALVAFIALPVTFLVKDSNSGETDLSANS